MAKLYFSFFLISSFLSLTAQVSGVGIGTTNPQQKLHLTQSVGTLRVEGLDKNNNDFNGGLTNPSNITYPLYVDSNGVLTLEMDPYQNSDGNDAFDNVTLPSSNVTLLAANVSGKVEATIFTYDITVTRPVLLEVKYNISFDVYRTNALGLVNDIYARRISNYYTHDVVLPAASVGARRYGQSSKSYFNNAASAVAGTMYNTSTSYIRLDTGTHKIHFKAEVSSPRYAKVAGNFTIIGANNTYVKFAIDIDSVFMRMH